MQKFTQKFTKNSKKERTKNVLHHHWCRAANGHRLAHTALLGEQGALSIHAAKRARRALLRAKRCRVGAVDRVPAQPWYEHWGHSPLPLPFLAGLQTATQRKRLLQRQQSKIEQHLIKLQKALKKVKFKIAVYEDMEAMGVDLFDKNSKHYYKNLPKYQQGCGEWFCGGLAVFKQLCKAKFWVGFAI